MADAKKEEPIKDTAMVVKPLPNLEVVQKTAVGSYRQAMEVHGIHEDIIDARILDFKEKGRVRYITTEYLYPKDEAELKEMVENPDGFKKPTPTPAPAPVTPKPDVVKK